MPSPAAATALRKLPTNPPPTYDSIGSLFKGREELLALLLEKIEGNRHRSNAHSTHRAARTGGVGKTRVAVEFASAHRTHLQPSSSSEPIRRHARPEPCQTCGAACLTTRKEAAESEVQVRQRFAGSKRTVAGSLSLIRDTEDAAVAVEALLARLAPHGRY